MKQVIYDDLLNPTEFALVSAMRLRTRVRSCTRCELSATCTEPIPWRGKRGSELMVVGEAPGRTEDKEGKPFVGPAGTLLERELDAAGIDVDKVIFDNAVRCWPDGTPLATHVRACSPHLLDTLRLMKPRWVITVGKVALGAFWADLWENLKLVHGRPLWYDDTAEGERWSCIVWPTYHPAAALRQGKYLQLLRDDIEGFVTWAKDRGGTEWPERCWRCFSDEVERYDERGLGMCSRHIGRQERLEI